MKKVRRAIVGLGGEEVWVEGRIYGVPMRSPRGAGSGFLALRTRRRRGPLLRHGGVQAVSIRAFAHR